MRRAVTSQLLEMNRSFYASRLAERASIIGASGYSQTASAKCQHLGHEGQAVELAVGIEARHDFRGTPDFDELAWFQVEYALEVSKAVRRRIDGKGLT